MFVFSGRERSQSRLSLMSDRQDLDSVSVASRNQHSEPGFGGARLRRRGSDTSCMLHFSFFFSLLPSAFFFFFFFFFFATIVPHWVPHFCKEVDQTLPVCSTFFVFFSFLFFPAFFYLLLLILFDTCHV